MGTPDGPVPRQITLSSKHRPLKQAPGLLFRHVHCRPDATNPSWIFNVRGVGFPPESVIDFTEMPT